MYRTSQNSAWRDAFAAVFRCNQRAAAIKIIYLYPDEDQKKKFFIANWLYLCPKLRKFVPNSDEEKKTKQRSLPQSNPVFSWNFGFIGITKHFFV